MIGTMIVVLAVLSSLLFYMLATRSLGLYTERFVYGILLPDVLLLSAMLIVIKSRPLLKLCSNVTVFLLGITVFFAIFINGGPIMASHNQMLIVLVALAFILTGRRSGLQWSILIVGIESVYYLLDATGYEFPNHQMAAATYTGEIFNFYNTLFAVVALLLALDSKRTAVSYVTDDDKNARNNTSNQDKLTRLANRQYFERVLNACIEDCRRHHNYSALLYIQLDQLDVIKNSYGDTTSDKVLQIIANRMRTMVRKDDTVARLGNNDIAVLLQSYDIERSLQDMAWIIHESISKPVVLFGFRFDINCSVGACRVTPEAGSVSHLLEQSRRGVYVSATDSSEPSTTCIRKTAASNSNG